VIIWDSYTLADSG